MNRKAVGAMIGLAGVVILISLAFVLPMKHSGPHDLPIGVAGPVAATSQIEDALTTSAPENFEFHEYGSANEVRTAIAERDVVGGIVVTPTGPTMLVASAGGAPIAQSLRGVAAALSTQAGTTVTVEDVVPTTADDPQGAGIAGLALPLVLGGIIPAIVFLQLLPRKPVQQAAAAVGFALLTGLGLSLILRFVIGTFDGSVIPVGLGIALGMSAISLTLIGLTANIGMAGFGLGAVTMMIVGNPLSGIASSAYWLPSGWSELGQLLPPGASATLLRSLAFFDGHGGGTAVVVLIAWVAVGAGLVLVARRRSANAGRHEAVEPAPVAA
ncbi:hypothetical protein [Williamsia sp. 1135]|uniref:hypothetical protein n=1 Tax=Williamsia sp. 1135 TaxID=1889262 RepID=UPI000A10E225|nr:hypothetical protein [Williamsia sp. 1135]ORM33186.1 hypothetical protein BFL43_14695 [Williamsia sp. 1135]